MHAEKPDGAANNAGMPARNITITNAVLSNVTAAPAASGRRLLAAVSNVSAADVSAEIDAGSLAGAQSVQATLSTANLLVSSSPCSSCCLRAGSGSCSQYASSPDRRMARAQPARLSEVLACPAFVSEACSHLDRLSMGAGSFGQEQCDCLLCESGVSPACRCDRHPYMHVGHAGQRVLHG